MDDPSDIPPPAFEHRLALTLRNLRQTAGWSLDDLTDRCGVSRATLSRIETREVSPTATALSKISGAYAMPVSRLVRLAEGAGPRILRADQQAHSTNPGSGHDQTRRAPAEGPFAVDVAEVSLPAQSTAKIDLRSDEEIHILVLSGQVTARTGEETQDLKSGDVLSAHPTSRVELTSAKRAAKCLIVRC